MSAAPSVHRCGCAACRAHRPHPERALHYRITLLASRLDEQQRRWFVALEAGRLGHGGTERLAQITGLSARTIRRGRRERAADLRGRPHDRVRVPGGGRPAREAEDPALVPALEAALAEETAGDPMGRRPKAKRSSLAPLRATRATTGHAASRPTVSRLLRALGYSPKVNARRTEARRAPPARHAPFAHLAAQRQQCAAAREPVISVDANKEGTRRRLPQRRPPLV